MKRTFIYMIVVVFMFAFTGISFAGQRGYNKRKNNQQYHRYQKKQHRSQYQYFNNKNRGYRYKWRGHRSHYPRHYRGHWRSWQSWQEHLRYNNRIYRHGRYYKRGGSLYFSFETNDGTFTFSIGR